MYINDYNTKKLFVNQKYQKDVFKISIYKFSLGVMLIVLDEIKELIKNNFKISFCKKLGVTLLNVTA